jgi:DNA (cytosine-5)-methyltransferase 1
VPRKALQIDLTDPAYLARPVILDLYCGAGGAAYGYYLAGYRVIGVDTDPLMLKRYPFESVLVDAIGAMADLNQFGLHLGYGRWLFLGEIEAIHASPPCRAYSKTQRIRQNQHDALIAATRLGLQRLGKPYIIENVMDARHDLHHPVMLCGAMFPGLRTYRHRLFETSFMLPQRPHGRHTQKQAKMGRPAKPDEFIHVVGNFSGADEGRAAMGISWMGRDQLKEAIPPAYTEYIAHFIP